MASTPSMSAPDVEQVREMACAGEVKRWAEAPTCGHAMVVPFAAQGHLNWSMQLAKQLASRWGFLVTFLITSQFHSRIPPSFTLHHNIRIAHIPDGLPPDVDRFAGNLEPLCRAFEGLAAPFELLMHKLMQEGPPVTCIFSDMFAPFTQDVANTFHLPRVALWLQSAASFTVNLHVPLLISNGHMPIKGAESADIITCIPAHPPLAPWELPSFYQVQDLSDFMVQFKLKPFLRLQEATCVLINTFYHLESKILDAINKELQEENDQHPPVLAAGPFLPPAYISNTPAHTIAARPSSSLDADTRTGTGLWAEDDDCLKWLDQQAPGSVLYISFGSIVSMEAAQFVELASGLDMTCSSSKALRLLWVIRPDFLKCMEQDRVLIPTTLSDRKEEGILYITTWAPQAMVLSHSSVGAFLTHCGWNSILEGVSLGVPMLGWPLFSEQWLNRKWVVEEWHIGMQFTEDEDGMVKREEVQRVIAAMMESPLGHRMRERALRLKDATTKAWMMPCGSSFTSLNTVIQNLQKKTQV